jgi:predicted dehydrogenase
MEKPFAADPGGIKRIIAAGEAAEKKNLKIGCGLMCRHSLSRQALIQKMRDGEMGQIILCRAIRMGPFGQMAKKPPQENEVLWQVKNRIHVFWTGGAVFQDFTIHLVDECCWIKNAWPAKAEGFGGRIPGSKDCGQNLDSYSIEYTFPDGTKAQCFARYAAGTESAFYTFAHGTKCAAQFSGNVHAPTVRMYKDQRYGDDNIAWEPEKEPISPYVQEWNVLLDAIRNDKPHNESKRGAYADLALLMGRSAVHMGRTITWEEMLKSDYTICKNLDTLNENGEPPLKLDAEGRLPCPVPGSYKDV